LRNTFLLLHQFRRRGRVSGFASKALFVQLRLLALFGRHLLGGLERGAVSTQSQIGFHGSFHEQLEAGHFDAFQLLLGSLVNFHLQPAFYQYMRYIAVSPRSKQVTPSIANDVSAMFVLATTFRPGV
jgi:hypothetical protein